MYYIYSGDDDMNDLIQQFNTEFNDNSIGFISFIICTIGVLIALFGKKFFLFRWILGDRSMISQIIVGTIIFIIGIGLLFITKS